MVFVEAETRVILVCLGQQTGFAMAVQPQKIVRSSACEGGDHLKMVSSYGGRSEEQRASVEASEKTEPCASRLWALVLNRASVRGETFSGGAWISPNPKHEIRNPKQLQIPKFESEKKRTL